MKSSSVLFLLGVLLIGCAKEKKYDKVPKDHTYSNELLSQDPNDPYVYVTSVENTPMNITASRPYWQGEQKLVTFKFNENNLEVLELPTDKKYSKNGNNFSPVFKLDIEHKDYRCTEDEYGECSNKEEEVDDRAWNKKKYFKADFSKLTVLETNTLPEQLANLMTNCFADKGSVVKSVQMDKDSLNIRVERTLSAKVQCADINSLEDLRNLTFKVNYHYSFVKLSKIASKDYQPVAYPNTDQNTFGFFTTKTKKLNADNQLSLDSDLTLMNRWSPTRKVIKYSLSEEFYDEDMASVLTQTHQAIRTINKSFAQAGVDLAVELEDGRGKDIGDLRNNFLVLVKDPQASGVIGYGPSVANPLTGEILKGQVVMYYGTILKFIQSTYDELIEEALEKKARAASPAAAIKDEVIEKGKFKHGLEKEFISRAESSLAARSDILNLFKVSDAIQAPMAAPVRNTQPMGKITANIKAKIKEEIFSWDPLESTCRHASLSIL